MASTLCSTPQALKAKHCVCVNLSQPRIEVGRYAARNPLCVSRPGAAVSKINTHQLMHHGRAGSMVCKALPPIDVDTATVVSVLKGPTLSEMFEYGTTAVSLVGAAWQAATAPFALFGTDRWGLNLLFYFAVLVMGYNLIISAPKQ